MTTGKVDDGGPAFPCSIGPSSDVGFVCSHEVEGGEGMSLLDWFAAQEKLGEDEPGVHLASALMGDLPPEYVADPAGAMRWAKWWAEACARLRYMRAAAMVAEKRRREGSGT